MFNKAVSAANGNEDLSVEILGGYRVTYNENTVTVPYGTAVSEAIKKLNVAGTEFNETGNVTSDLTLTKKDAPTPPSGGGAVGPTDNVTNEMCIRDR